MQCTTKSCKAWFSLQFRSTLAPKGIGHSTTFSTTGFTNRRADKVIYRGHISLLKDKKEMELKRLHKIFYKVNCYSFNIYTKDYIYCCLLNIWITQLYVIVWYRQITKHFNWYSDVNCRKRENIVLLRYFDICKW